MAGSIVLDKKRCVVIAWLGIVASILAMGIWVTCIWIQIWRYSNTVEELAYKSGATFTVLSIWCPHLGLLSLLRLDRTRFQWVRRVTCGVATAFAGIFLVAFWTEELGEFIGKTRAVLAILGSCGTIVTPILALVERLGRTGEDGGLESTIIVHLTCPRCEREQDLKTGDSRCGACGLRITIDVEEPRCTCGYLLYQLQSDVCPECGRPIVDAKWGGAGRAGIKLADGSADSCPSGPVDGQSSASCTSAES
jgi:ribosomal protein L37E